MDQLTRSHPNAGILLLGDFNQLPEAHLESCPLEQVVTTQPVVILDKIFYFNIESGTRRHTSSHSF